MKKFKKEMSLWGLTFLLLFAACLRLYRINDFATFLGDEGRDALVVKRMLVDGRLTLLGPSTSVGNLYLGPAYYYLMLPALWLANLNPVGPAVMVALFGVATVGLIWQAGRDFFGPKAGWASALLYAVSQPIIEHTRFSWNPNPMPFFALLAVWAVFKAAKTEKGFWLAVVGACLGIAVQLHYLALGLVGVVMVLLVMLRPRVSWRWYLALAGAGLAVVLPMILFELRHGFLITNGLVRFVREEDKLGMTVLILVQRMVGSFWRLHTHFLATDRVGLTGIVLLIESLWWRRIVRNRSENPAGRILLVWLGVGLAVVGLYTGDVHDHYLGFIFPVPFLLIGAWFERRSWLRFFGRTVFLALFLLNFFRLDAVVGRQPNAQIERARQVGESIAQDVPEGESFNLALISPTRDFRAMNYRYFTEVYGRPAEGFENYDRIETLYVIIEGEDPNPVGLTSWEIDTFSPKELVGEWRFDFGYRVEKYQRPEGEL